MKFKEAYYQYEKYIDIKLKIQTKNTLKERFKNHILPYWQNYDIYSITNNDYIEWQNKINSKIYSYNFKQSLHFAMSGFFKYCNLYFNVKKNIPKEIGGFKKQQKDIKEHNFYTIKEFKKFIKQVDNQIYKQFFILMFFTGTRPGEAMALKFSDLSNNKLSINKTINEHGKREIGTPKTLSSYRTITIDNKLKKDLLNLKKLYKIKYDHIDNEYFIFGGIKPIAPTTINRYKINACKKPNLNPIKLHEFRHSHATLLLNKGILIHDISKRLGHSNVSTTLNIYTHSNEDNKKRVIKTLSHIRLFL